MPNKSRILLVGTLTCAIAAVAADKKPDISKLPAPAAKTGVTWDKDIKGFIDTSCGTCHGGDKPKGKYRVDTKENFVKGGDSEEKAVVTGKSAESPAVLYSADLVEDMEMPPTDKRDKYPALTKDQLALLRAWIDQGAK